MKIILFVILNKDYMDQRLSTHCESSCCATAICLLGKKLTLPVKLGKDQIPYF